MKKSNITAIFDVDKTLVDGYAIIDFAKFLTQKKIFIEKEWQLIERYIQYYKNKKIDYNSFADLVVEAYARGVKNQKKLQLQELSKTFWKKRYNQIYPFLQSVFDLLSILEAETIALSGSELISLEPFVKKFQFNQVYSTQIEFSSQGIATGILGQNMASHSNKKNTVLQIFEERKDHLTIGFGDSIADLAFLELVDIPIVVGEHDRELGSIARKEGWYVIKDAKNQTYALLQYLEEKLSFINKTQINIEKLWWVNKSDEVIGGTYRFIADKETEATHREVGVIIVRNSDSAVYFQKRSANKKVLPNVWSTGCAGHVEYGMSARDTACKELKEELSYNTNPDKLEYLGKEFTQRPNETHFKYWYVLKVDENFSPVIDPSEIADGKFLTPQEISRMKDNGEQFYENYLNIVARYLDNDLDSLLKHEEPTDEKSNR